AWKILIACYRFLLVSLDEYDPDQNRLFSERDNFQSLCVTLVSLCFDDHRRRERIYRKIVRDLCILGEENPLLTVEHFDWFQHVSEECLGKKTIHKLLYRADAEDYMKTYAHLLEECQNMRAEWRKQKIEEPQTAEEVYHLLKIGKRPGREWALLLACGWMKRNKEQEVVRLAAYYKEEKTGISAVRSCGCWQKRNVRGHWIRRSCLRIPGQNIRSFLSGLLLLWVTGGTGKCGRMHWNFCKKKHIQPRQYPCWQKIMRPAIRRFWQVQ
ncbi:MAG: hypothetical protein K2G51_04975, partial [Lachnospiraceae bacterium]|nr:hypothetical protein [Lachnospiraceae bacterium]